MGHDKNSENQSMHHIVPLSDYLKIFGTLLVLTFITVAVAQFDFGKWNMIVAMVIASIKAFLVLSIFMHLKYDDMLNRVIFGAGVFFLLIMYSFSAFDIWTRVNATPH